MRARMAVFAVALTFVVACSPGLGASGPTPIASPAPQSADRDGETFVMPDLVGRTLQEAQDRLQALGSFLLDQEDATGRGRSQYVDRNWKVCRQEPDAGTDARVVDPVTLWSVKLGEECP